MTLTYPRQKTIKRLFAVSGNQCYFPKCNTPLVDKESGKVTGKICHIKGNRSGAARYDQNQTDEERHGFDNLILMCQIHHDVIDDVPDSYTVSRLYEIKAEHEKIHAKGEEPSDEIINQFILSITQGSVIYSKDQKGGQIAHSIINIVYEDKAVLIQNLFNKIVILIERLLKDDFGVFDKRLINFVRDLDRSPIKDVFGMIVSQNPKGSENIIEFLNGIYKLYIQISIDGIRFGLKRNNVIINILNHIELLDFYIELQYFSMESSGFQPVLPRDLVNCKIKFYRDVKQFGFGRGIEVLAMWDSMTINKFTYEIYNLGKIPFFPVTIGIISESTILIEEKVIGSKVELNSTFKGDFDEYDLFNKIEKQNMQFPLKIKFFFLIDTGKKLYSDDIELTGNNIKNKIEIVDYDILDNHIDKLRGTIFSVNDPFLRRIRIELAKISRNKKIDENHRPIIQKAVKFALEGITITDEKTKKIETFLDILYLLTFTAESLEMIEELCLESLETLYKEGSRNHDLLRILYAIGYFGDLESAIMRAIDDKVPKFLTYLKDQFCIFIYDEEKKEILKNNRKNMTNQLYDKKKELRPETDELGKIIGEIINELIYKYENLH